MITKHCILFFSLFLGVTVASVPSAWSQVTSQNNLSRQVDGLIRIAEVGTVVDTVNVWGDVARSGRYVIPRDLTIPQLISYAGGLGVGSRSRQELEWVNNRISIRINRYLSDNKMVEIKSFESNYEEALPAELFTYKLRNEDIISIEVRRKPNFWDYLGRAAPIIGIMTSAIILYDRF